MNNLEASYPTNEDGSAGGIAFPFGVQDEDGMGCEELVSLKHVGTFTDLSRELLCASYTNTHAHSLVLAEVFLGSAETRNGFRL